MLKKSGLQSAFDNLRPISNLACISKLIELIMLNVASSDKFDLNFGVPHGSCSGHLLFILYASKLFDIIDIHLSDSHCCADDSQLYVSFKPDDFAWPM
jgi:hypothetical protein